MEYARLDTTDNPVRKQHAADRSCPADAETRRRERRQNLSQTDRYHQIGIVADTLGAHVWEWSSSQDQSKAWGDIMPGSDQICVVGCGYVGLRDCNRGLPSRVIESARHTTSIRHGRRVRRVPQLPHD